MASASSSSLTRQWEYDVFLSFNSEDRSFASELYYALAEEGIKICRDEDIVPEVSNIPGWTLHQEAESEVFQVIEDILLGKAIVNEAKEPGKCSRLWMHEDIDNVLKENTGTEAVQGIVLDFPVTKVVHWNPEAFSKMCFQPVELFVLKMCLSKIKRLWRGIMYWNNLRVIELSHSRNLVRTPDFTGVTNLERINLEAEPETNLISLKNLELLSVHGTEVTEKEGGMSLRKKEIKTVLSQTKEGQMKSKLKKKVGDPIEPHTPVAVSTSGLSKLEGSFVGSSEVIEPEIQPNSLEKRVLLSLHGTEAMEKEARMSILEFEIEAVPSQTKEGQMRFKSTKHVGEPIEPPTPLEVSISGTSKEATVEPVTVLCSGIDGSQPINEEQIEILRQTDGQQFLERTCPKRSIERTLTTILGYMSDVKAQRVGVYGSGGIGKTSVLKALINYPTTKDLFDVVIWVTVSRNWSTRKIQDKVLQQLSLSAGDFKTDFELAEELFQALRSQRFLLLLDDVWEWIDLNAIGIPDPTYENGCRMILATRSPDVCHIMVADRKVQVEGLLLEEAWELFREQVGGIIDSPNIFPYAQAIVKKCHGLPLLIIVTGRALAKENDALNWMRASRNFLWLSAHGIYGFEGLIQQLKFSYDRLESSELKSCFLYCVLLPEDREVGIVKLVEYWIEEGLVAGNWTDSYKRGCDIVNILVEASLLQKLEGGLSIKMHDLIRDLALGILSLETEGCQFLLRSYSRMTQLSHMGNGSFFRPIVSFKSNQPLILEDHQFLSRAGAGLTELPLKEKWEEVKMIFLMDNELSSLPDSPSCPKLLALFLQRNQKLRVIPTSFFDLMPSLTVLNLSKTRIKSLPKSLCKLMSLEVLILRDCERLVLFPSEVGSLRRLEVLDLQGTEINKLPSKISELSSLIYLKVSFYGSVNWSEYAKLPQELVSRGIIANLVELETLSIDVYPGDRRWNKNAKSVIDEVGKLTNLTTFCCYFPEVEFLERFLATSLSWKIGGLTEFKFVVGHDVKRFVSKVVDNLAFDNVTWDQCLRFVNGEVIPDAAVEVLTRTTAFYLDHHINVCSLSEFGVSNLDGLRLCVVRECPKIETIIASKELSEAVFPILEHLSINYLSNLSTILEGMIPLGSFAKLRILTVRTCPKLQFVFASSMLHFFSNLEELIVEDCPAITEIIYQDLVVDSVRGTLPSLKKLKLHYLPRLVNIMKGEWPPLENISFYDCPILKKLGIDFIASHTIKGIKAENDWWKELEWQDTSFHLRLQAHFTPICDDDLGGGQPRKSHISVTA
ncbi:hypothetical protein CMV_018218 [Castanea mollissima]|uniref:AAA+ ATPase domain-containing protein n=1 Tax=Castanea mollissima TaxID=60419 RepID=A0A8J4QPS5_9ROSI|nr:hypothetical protein CMV_018218 [Castanea mollissima]